MRNTTKLKQLLEYYSVGLDLSPEGKFILHLVLKELPEEMHTFEGDNYSAVLRKAYSFHSKKIKKK